MNVLTTNSARSETDAVTTPDMRSDKLAQLASGLAMREAEKPDFEKFVRTEAFARLDEMLDAMAETLTDLAVDDTVEDLLLSKNQALSDALRNANNGVIPANLGKPNANLEKRVKMYAEERKEFLLQRQYARSYRYLIKTFCARILETLRLKSVPPVE